MAKATGKGNWSYSGIPGLTVGESSTMKAIRKKYPSLTPPKKRKYTSPDSPKNRVTQPVIRPGVPYQKDKNVNKIYKTY